MHIFPSLKFDPSDAEGHGIFALFSHAERIFDGTSFKSLRPDCRSFHTSHTAFFFFSFYFFRNSFFTFIFQFLLAYNKIYM